MIYILKKKNSPYYVKDIVTSVDINFGEYYRATFTDVKEFIDLKINGKTKALEKIRLLRNHYPSDIDFEIEKL